MFLRIYIMCNREKIQNKRVWCSRIHTYIETCARGYLSKNCQGLERVHARIVLSLDFLGGWYGKKVTEGNVKRKSDCLQTGRVYKEASLRFSLFFFFHSASFSRSKGKKALWRGASAVSPALKYTAAEKMEKERREGRLRGPQVWNCWRCSMRREILKSGCVEFFL